MCFYYYINLFLNQSLDLVISMPFKCSVVHCHSDNSKHIVAYVAGCISHSLIQLSNCDICFELLQKDQMNNSYNILNRGGLQLPTVILYQYVETAFCILESLESQILATKLPTKHVMLQLLAQVSVEWDSGFVCDLHVTEGCKRVHSIITNLYLKGLSNEASETIRKSQVDSFNRHGRQIFGTFF